MDNLTMTSFVDTLNGPAMDSSQHQSDGGRAATIDAVEVTSSLQSRDGSFLEHEGPVQESKIKKCLLSCSSCHHPLSRKHNPLSSNPTFLQLLKYSFLCPPHGTVGKWLTLVLIILLVFGSLVSILGATSLPGGNIFSLCVLFVLALVGGHAITPLRLPPLLGMLVVGILLKSVPGISEIGKNIDRDWASALRNIALVVILLRAGLGLDPAALKQLSFMVVRLAFSPCIIETIVVATVSHLLLGFPWLWGLMLGFVLSAVTPAVIVPCMLVLSEKGYGVEKGIPTLVIAASTIDDVLAISGFGILLGITFAEGELWVVILKGPFEVLVGLLFGLIFGVLCWVLPNRKEQEAQVMRFAIILSAGLLSVFGSQMVELGGAGALGCLVMAFVAGFGWRRQGMTDENYVDHLLGYVWEFFQPFLFALIGAEIQLDQLDGNTVGYGLITITIGLIFRMITSFLVVMGGELSVKERIFVALAWLPKATVQAAIGSQALNYARKTAAGPEAEKLGLQVLTIAVLVILITAPLGAAAITLSAPKLLSRSNQAHTQSPGTPEKTMEA
ncbi:sodium/hydrogen exchanger 9B2-like [Homarus americanus]|uniref:Sodium/hydrogen exchanger 9B2-like 1 n=1 Tax=Homarus americanus TaxID=6706 RepID=A0A8J5JFU2_HOMAM|nr:sodium/hydrogen exchanger 9B2-like [Homarus americanus]XP_042203787.1 sodium/hydrogen exchanger 9B2-like [Homarus americanus]KAG7156541.1 Sodium/hydrogen exchanger 9B2-like 1 [Homarus americanus]